MTDAPIVTQLLAGKHARGRKLGSGPNPEPNPVDVHIGQRLRFRRMMIGLSQEDLADTVGVAFQQIQKYECAVNRVSTSRLWDLSVALQCPVAFFYEGMDGGPAGPGRSENQPTDVTAAPADVSMRQETLKLVRAYYTIKHPNTRKRILELAASLGHGGNTAPSP